MLQFTAGIDKGSVKQPTYNPDGSVSNEAVSLFNDPFKLGKMGIGEGERVDYTGDRVVELVAADATVITPAWTPVVNNEVIAIAADGTETTLTLTNGSVTVTAGAYTKVKYIYDNILVPAEQIPTLKAHMASIALEAKARRIAIFYSQMAARIYNYIKQHLIVYNRSFT